MWSTVTMSLLPVAVMMMSALLTPLSQVSTLKPSIIACNAQMGSISAITPRAPCPRSDSAQPLPTSPYPQITASLPAISTSTARLIPSTSECRHPYLLSNFDLVTESLTLIAGNSSAPAEASWYNRCTPVVVSSVTPRMPSPIAVHLPGVAASEARSTSRNTVHSSESLSSALGTTPAFSNATPLCTIRVASPPSSRIMFGPAPSGHVSICSAHHQYSVRFSPFQAKHGTPCGSSAVPCGPTTTA